MKRKPAPPTAPAVPAAVAAPLAASLPTAHQPGRAAAGPAFVAVYGGGSECPDGGKHLIRLSDDVEAPDRCDRCEALLRMDGDDWRGPGRQLAEANARAEHWAAQADRLARQVERMREAMEAVAGDLVDFPVAMPDPYWDGLADRLRAAAKGGNDVE